MDIYEIVTNRIIEKLEQGVIPWRKPWKDADRPVNAITRRPYTGVNFFLLAASRLASPYWITWNQTQQLDGHVREGERSEIVVFWKTYEGERQVTADQAQEAESEKARKRFVLRYYRLWNVEQVELPEKARAKFQTETRTFDPIAQAEQIIAEMPDPPAIEFHGSLAFYRPSTDTVVLPPREAFQSSETLYETTYHELVHSVGHSKRLNRPGITESIHFGSERYGREELIAELGAAFLCAAAGIDNATIENQAAYLEGWLDALKADKRAIVHAAAQAQKAADYVLGSSADA